MHERSQVIEKNSDTNKRSSAPKAQNIEFSPSSSTPADRILSLQRTIGNQAVQRLFKGVGGRRSAVGGQIQPKLTIGQPNDIYEQEADRVAEQVMRMPEPQVQCQEEEEEEEKVIQTKLAINQPGDKYEQEADRMAEQVVRMPEAFGQRQPLEEEEEEKLMAKHLLQRQPLEEDEEIQTRKIQRKMSNENTPASSDIENRINQSKEGGQPLHAETQSFMERRFGTDFSNVKVHNASTAVQMNKEVNSQAFTVGNNIYFNSGRYDTGSDTGKQLLAHELTHTLQQGSSPFVQRTPIPANTTNLNTLRGYFDDGQEDDASTLMGNLSDDEKDTVQSSMEFKELAISCFDNEEMYRSDERPSMPLKKEAMSSSFVGLLSPRIQRETVRQCDPTPAFSNQNPQDVRNTHGRAIQMLRRAHERSQHPLFSDVQAAAQRWFGITDFHVSSGLRRTHWQVVIDSIASMNRRAHQAIYHCHSTQTGMCGANTFAWTGLARIHICPYWWTSSSDIDERAQTLIHEWAHRFIRVGSRGEVYCQADVASLPVRRRVRMADAYSGYIYELATGNPYC